MKRRVALSVFMILVLMTALYPVFAGGLADYADIPRYTGTAQTHEYLSSFDKIREKYFAGYKSKVETFKKGEFETTDEFIRRVSETMEEYVANEIQLRVSVPDKIMISFPVSFKYAADYTMASFEADNVVPPELTVSTLAPKKSRKPYPIVPPGNRSYAMRVPALVNHRDFYLQCKVPLDIAKLLRENEKHNVMNVIIHFEFVQDFMGFKKGPSRGDAVQLIPYWETQWLELQFVEGILTNTEANVELRVF